MVVVRLQRVGTKKTPHHRIVVSEQSRAQSGRVLEVVGHYDPSRDPAQFTVKEERLRHWIGSGAQVSEALTKLLKRFSKAAAASAK